MAQAPPILIWSPGGGVSTPIGSNPPVYSQAGTTALIENQEYVDVVFGSIQTTDEWILTECIVVNETDVDPLNLWPGIITDKTAAGFRIYFNGMPDSGSYYLHWAVSGINVEPSAATTYQLSGSSSGALGAAATFTVSLPASTFVTGSVIVTPSEGGLEIGVFSPETVTLTTDSPQATFTFTPALYGDTTITVNNDSGLTDPGDLAFTALAATYHLSGPSTGNSGVPSSNFTVVLPVGSVVIGTVTVTPSDGGDGGTFTPTTVGLTTASPSATFTYTPASLGVKTISATNDGDLSDPVDLTYTAADVIYSRALTIDHTKVPSTQTDFPVLVNITDVTFKTQANAGHVKSSSGYDIQFFSDSGLTTKLKWEVEKYVPTTGELVAWVKIASLSSSVDTVFYMSYGDSSVITSQADPVNVWTNSFTSVYHLGNGTTLSAADSLGAVNGTLSGSSGVPTAATGMVDGGGAFVAANAHYINLGSLSAPPAATLSCWVRGTTFPNTYNAVANRSSVFGFFVKPSGKLALFLFAAGGISYDGTGATTLSTGTWYHLSASYDSVGGLVVYVNASVDATAAAGGTLNSTAGLCYIGGDSGTSGRNWNGTLDEFRVSNVVRSANWVTTEYNNQNSPGTFITLGTEA